MQKQYKGRYRSATTRLRGYDYASAGWYHVVMCTQDRVCWLGDIRNGIVGLSPVGCRAYRNCAAIPDHFDHAVMDAFIVMPNHVHAIIGLTASAPIIVVATRDLASLPAMNIRPPRPRPTPSDR